MRTEKKTEYKYTLKFWIDKKVGNEVAGQVFYAKLRIDTGQNNAEYIESDLEVKPGRENEIPVSVRKKPRDVVTVDKDGNITIVADITKVDKETGEAEK